MLSVICRISRETCVSGHEIEGVASMTQNEAIDSCRLVWFVKKSIRYHFSLTSLF